MDSYELSTTEGYKCVILEVEHCQAGGVHSSATLSYSILKWLVLGILPTWSLHHFAQVLCEFWMTVANATYVMEHVIAIELVISSGNMVEMKWRMLL